MTVAERACHADLEVLELLADRPELLAIADAVAGTQARPRRRRRSPRLLAAAVLALGLAVLPLAPWRGGESSLTERALAAIGPLPVVHAVIEAEDPRSVLVDLATGRREPTTIQIEYWFDDDRARLRSLQHRDGVLQGEVLQMGDGGSADGAVLAPAGSRPSLSPGLAAFVRGYRRALAEGAARVMGDAEVGGRPVTWLDFPGAHGSERVALDRRTSLPVMLRTIGPDGERSPFDWRVRTIETVERREADFTPPRRLPPRPSSGEVRESRPVALGDADLPAGSFWLGEPFAGLRLASVELQELTRGYAPGLGLRSERGSGVEVVYGDRKRFVRLQEARAPEPAYAFAGGRTTFGGNAIPAQGSLALLELVGAGADGERGCVGQLQREGTYITIWSSDAALCVAAAQALRPLDGSAG